MYSLAYIMYSQVYIGKDRKMNRIQKMAVFNICVLLTSILLSGAAVIWIGIKHGYPFGLCGFGFLGLSIFRFFGHIIYPKKKGSIFDERDEHIQKQAVFNGESASNTLFLSVFLIGFFIGGIDATITVGRFGVIIAGAYVTSKLIESITILILYGREGRNGE